MQFPYAERNLALSRHHVEAAQDYTCVASAAVLRSAATRCM